MRSVCEEEIFGMITEINKVAPFTNLNSVERLFGDKISLIMYRFTTDVSDQFRNISSFVENYISSSSVLVWHNLRCFVDKLMEMYNNKKSIEDLAASLSKLLRRINENSVSTYFPTLY